MDTSWWLEGSLLEGLFGSTAPRQFDAKSGVNMRLSM